MLISSGNLIDPIAESLWNWLAGNPNSEPNQTEEDTINLLQSQIDSGDEDVRMSAAFKLAKYGKSKFLVETMALNRGTKSSMSILSNVGNAALLVPCTLAVSLNTPKSLWKEVEESLMIQILENRASTGSKYG